MKIGVYVGTGRNGNHQLRSGFDCRLGMKCVSGTATPAKTKPTSRCWRKAVGQPPRNFVDGCGEVVIVMLLNDGCRLSAGSTEGRTGF